MIKEKNDYSSHDRLDTDCAWSRVVDSAGLADDPPGLRQLLVQGKFKTFI